MADRVMRLPGLCSPGTTRVQGGQVASACGQVSDRTTSCRKSQSETGTMPLWPCTGSAEEQTMRRMQGRQSRLN
jgi:hypothetical protein